MVNDACAFYTEICILEDKILTVILLIYSLGKALNLRVIMKKF